MFPPTCLKIHKSSTSCGEKQKFGVIYQRHILPSGHILQIWFILDEDQKSRAHCPLPTDLEACISITCMSTFSIIYSLPTDAANAALPFILRLISQAKNAP